MFVTAVAAIIVTMSLALLRATLGPTVFDRILALNVFGTKTVLLIAVMGFLTGRPDFLDLALLYALLNFIGVIAVLRFSKYGHFADPELGR
ncbi:MAG: pH regulation protein F [Planctomycetales bacterium]|nr:pH regulation protein F [Planctomycetales bacterium]NIM09768.1 pH regulation protein F [Planctomycetales bacterium]NIN09237.1 pH regulation protein F [Planctomycetales bacterium]NIN78337.1 pH regulation protein F [Planctomycetales bacterium]NIO35516.1 pH regulation protein F [Planctomycetales bacterium]